MMNNVNLFLVTSLSDDAVTLLMCLHMTADPTLIAVIDALGLCKQVIFPEDSLGLIVRKIMSIKL